MVPILQGSKQ